MNRLQGRPAWGREPYTGIFRTELSCSKLFASGFALALLGTVIAVSPIAQAVTVVVQEYNWDQPYWHHHRGYWVYRHGEHIFITVD